MPLIIGSGSGGTQPGAPSISSVNAGNGQVTVNFNAPSYLGKPSGTSYTVTATPGGATATGSGSPLTVSGLSNGTTYSFVVTLSNGVSISLPSSSSSGTPVAPPFFPPFFPPSFGPWFPWFPPPPRFAGCIDGETLISVVGSGDTVTYKMAKDLVIGDSIWAPTYTEYTDESAQPVEEWEAEMLTNMIKVPTTVVSVVPTMKKTMFFNNDETTRVSLEQLMLVKPANDLWQYLYSGQLTVGDTIIRYNPEADTFNPTEITEITLETEEPRDVYAISVEDTDLFIAGNMAVHNK